MVILSLDCQLLPWDVKSFLLSELFRVVVTLFNSACSGWLGLQIIQFVYELLFACTQHCQCLKSTGYWCGYKIESEKVIECNFRRSHHIRHKIHCQIKGISVHIDPQLLFQSCINSICKSSSQQWKFTQVQTLQLPTRYDSSTRHINNRVH